MANCLVTGGSKEDIAPMAVLLLNVKQTQSWVDHVIIYHDGISEKDQKLMNSIMPVEFIKYRFPGSTKNFNEIVRYVYTPLVFCKYECFKLLERFDNVLWTDYDVVIQKDLSSVIYHNDGGFSSLFYRPESAVFPFRAQVRNNIWDELEKENFPLDTASIMTSVICLSCKLKNSAEIYKHCIAFSEKYGHSLIFPEQAVLDMVISKLKLSCNSLSWLLSVHPILEPDLVKDAFILHAYSQPKFWNGLYNETWQKNYAQWLQMGGTPWRKSSLKKKFQKICISLAFLRHRFIG